MGLVATIPVEIGELRRAERAQAARVIARGMRDTPDHIALFGTDPVRRLSALESLFRATVPALSPPPICARHEGRVLGVAAYTLHDPSQRRVGEALRQLPGMLRFSFRHVRSLPGLSRYASDLMRHDPAQPHWHIGPVAVDAGLQRKGIGTQLMAALCQRLDQTHNPAHLETEQAVNVLFYEQFGFHTVEEGQVIGLRHWFMRREPAAGG